MLATRAEGSAVRRWRRARARNSAQTPLCARIPFPLSGVINFSLFERKVTKEANEPAARPPRRTICRPKKFRPHLTHKPSVQMGCHRGIADAPNHRFFPTECVRQSRFFITRTAPRAPYGHRRGLCVGASVRARILFYIAGSEATFLPSLAREGGRRSLTDE